MFKLSLVAAMVVIIKSTTRRLSSKDVYKRQGVLQAFPIANHCITMDEPFKIIYGVEGYFVNDLKKLVTNDKGQTLFDDYVVFDLETTGFSPLHDAIIEIGAVKVSNGEIADHYSVFVNPQRPIPLRITAVSYTHLIG